MFYTLASKIPLINDGKSSNNFIKIFVVGSIFYLMLHHYLYSGVAPELLDKIKSWIYIY